ncbi:MULTISPECIES: hypothetical protein [unclassified Bradyrhizobium]|uniref:hypothetical protein n=1 Tax=unclassified Bradyrhizobium TaxID=2631580 RepID=UPI0012EB0593|nr:hypothetical protein [Bradyrhizobium sp. th.b2]
MQFILVTGRTPCSNPVCVSCETPIGAAYLRELGTHLTYCDHGCYADHRDRTIELIECRATAS